MHMRVEEHACAAQGTGMVGVPGTASDIFGAVRDAGVNVIMISQVSVCSLLLCPKESCGSSI
jgi:aspartokinase